MTVRLLAFTQKGMELARLRDEQVDMFTTVFIGAATTQAVAGRMVTPRGYEAKRRKCLFSAARRRAVCWHGSFRRWARRSP